MTKEVSARSSGMLHKRIETPWWGEDLTGMYPKAENYPHLPESDYKRKYKQLREVMRKEDLDCLLIAGRPAIVWISGYIPFAYGMYVVFPREGDPVMIKSFGHQTPTARATSYIKDIRDPRLGSEPRLFDFHKVIETTLKEWKLEKGNIGICGWEVWEWEPERIISYKVYTHLLKTFPKAKFKSFSNLILNLAKVHSSAEIEFIEKSAEMLDLVFSELMEKVKPGMKECEIWGIVRYVLNREGGDEPFSQLIVTHPQLAPVGARFGASYPSMRTLQKGDIITGEYSSRYGGYSSQGGKPISIGSPTKEWKDLYDVGLEAYWKLVDKFRPGNTAEEAAEAGRKVFEEASVFGSIHGHLMGIQVERSLPNEPLVEGMTMIAHSWPYSKDYTKGHFIGDAWQITDGAPRCLHKLPQQIIVV